MFHVKQTIFLTWLGALDERWSILKFGMMEKDFLLMGPAFIYAFMQIIKVFPIILILKQPGEY